MNTFHIDCKASRFVKLDHLNELKALIKNGEIKNSNILILGGGSNMLLTKDFDGLVLHPQFKGIGVLEEDESVVKVRVGAGEIWSDFVEYTVNNGWCGIENLALIPGMLGAAPMQNIGAYGVELKDVFDHLRAVDLETGELIKFSKEACEFDYRSSIFKTTLKGKFLIYDVCLELQKQPKPNISYQALIDYFKGVPEANIKQESVFQAVVDIRSSKLPDPDEIGNAGSFFKNSLVSKAKFKALQTKFPDIVGYDLTNGNVKLATAWLIEKTGWKGFRKADAGVHEKQALVLVNYGNASGQEIYDLSKEIKKSVLSMFGVSLEGEVNIL